MKKKNIIILSYFIFALLCVSGMFLLGKLWDKKENKWNLKHAIHYEDSLNFKLTSIRADRMGIYLNDTLIFFSEGDQRFCNVKKKKDIIVSLEQDLENSIKISVVKKKNTNKIIFTTPEYFCYFIMNFSTNYYGGNNK